MVAETSGEQRRHDRTIRLAERTFVIAVERPPDEPLWRDGLFWLTLGCTLFAAAPFALPGYFWGANDARHHVYFLFEFDRLVQAGVWWPRWSPDFAFGYGYPFFNIYAPLSHFLAELLLHFGGFQHTDAIKAIFALSVVGSGAAMFLFVRSWIGSAAATVAALVYVFAPYHLLNLYVRANLAESMAFVWLPLCLWTVRQAVLCPSWRWVIGLALSYAGLMFTSNLVVVLFTGVLCLYGVVLAVVYGSPDGMSAPRIPLPVRVALWVRVGLPAAIGVIAGLGLSAIFWLPAMLEQQYVRVDQWFAGRYDFRDNFVYVYQLFSPHWGFGVSQAGPNDAFGFQLGAAPLALAVIGLLLAWPLLGRDRWEVRYFLLAGLAATLVTLPLSRLLWELPIIGVVLGYAQFPWRWFGITVLCLSVLAGLVAHPLVVRSGARLTLPLLGLMSVILLSSYPYLRVEIREPAEGPVSLAGLMRFQQSSDEMTGSTAWVREIPTWSPMADYYISQDEAGGPVLPVSTLVDYGNPTWPLDYATFAVSSVAYNVTQEEVFFVNLREDEQRVVFNHFYYPGWRAWLLDGEHGAIVRELPIIPEERGTLGRMTVPVPGGEGYLLLRFEDTPPRTIGRAISIITLAALLLWKVVILLWRTRRTRAAPAA
ncbi:MAG: hypothetical protein KJZ93_09730 [Caldilineaceae bacterium]|nr:hypothetical protein [Caldilineaceae bacterium]